MLRNLRLVTFWLALSTVPVVAAPIAADTFIAEAAFECSVLASDGQTQADLMAVGMEHATRFFSALDADNPKPPLDAPLISPWFSNAAYFELKITGSAEFAAGSVYQSYVQATEMSVRQDAVRNNRSEDDERLEQFSTQNCLVITAN